MVTCSNTCSNLHALGQAGVLDEEVQATCIYCTLGIIIVRNTFYHINTLYWKSPLKPLKLLTLLMCWGSDSDSNVRFKCKWVFYYFNSPDELYLPPMRKIDCLLSEQKKRLLRRVNMSAQHQVNLHILLVCFTGTSQITNLMPLIAFCFPLSRRLYIYSPKWRQTHWNLELSEFILVGRVITAKPLTESRGVFLSNR